MFGWYNVAFGNSTLLYWTIAFIASVLFLYYFFKTMKALEALPLKLYPEELMIKDYRGIKWSGSTFASVQWGTKNLALTNKRLALSAQFFGAETYKEVLSFFYEKEEYEKHKGMTAWLLKDVSLDDDSVVVIGESETQSFNKITWKFKENKDFLFETVQKYHKK